MLSHYTLFKGKNAQGNITDTHRSKYAQENASVSHWIVYILKRFLCHNQEEFYLWVARMGHTCKSINVTHCISGFKKTIVILTDEDLTKFNSLLWKSSQHIRCRRDISPQINEHLDDCLCDTEKGCP